MPIKTVILDRDGTLYDEVAGKLQDGVPEMLERLRGFGLNICVVSNKERDKKIEDLLGVTLDQCLYHSDCGNKGSKKYVEEAMRRTGVERNEIVYLGDSQQDMREASSNRVAFFNAEWSNPGYEYGFRERKPSEFADDIEHYFLKEHLWYFTVDADDKLKRPILFRALLDPDTAQDNGITSLLKQRKEELDEDEWNLAARLVTHLLASLYMEGLHLIRQPNRNGGLMNPLWCIYPGSSGEKSPVLRLFEQFASRLLTMNYEESLLQRHVIAPSSHRARKSGNGPQEISVQFNSVQVNPDLVRRVKGNVVFVADDFSTGSNAMETARNLLFASGAGRVVGLTVGKYGRNYTGFTPRDTYVLPTKGGPATVDDRQLESQKMFAKINTEALAEF